jgi:hypothetical protein
MVYSATERCQSGRMCRSRKAVRCKPSWVRIPLSPLPILEESHSGLVSTTGNRVRCKPSWVQIPPPPPHIFARFLFCVSISLQNILFFIFHTLSVITKGGRSFSVSKKRQSLFLLATLLLRVEKDIWQVVRFTQPARYPFLLCIWVMGRESNTFPGRFKKFPETYGKMLDNFVRVWHIIGAQEKTHTEQPNNVNDNFNFAESKE